jgi:beta-galactosidase/beta-glucuronidase
MGEAALWSLSHPNLYTVAVSLHDATTTRVIDDVRQTHTHTSIYDTDI